ncbi:MAG TPA: methyl-accepting chemotaxis protein [Albitalea sp.]|uniref:methyl-accepting chemotaxis protein n=1 Tax=Piscinibacter sp. TaxID=1903157 RepID=UPI002ED22AB0
MNLNNLKIGTRLLLGFGLVLALLLVSVGVSFVSLVRMQQDMSAATAYEEHANLADKWLQKTQLNVNRTIAIAKAAGQPDVEAYFAPLMKQTSAEITEIQKAFESSAADAQTKAMLAAIGDKRGVYIEHRGKLLEFLKSADQVAVESTLKDKLLPAAEAYVQAMADLEKHASTQATRRSDEVRASLRTATIVLAVLVAASLVVGIGGALIITRSVTRPLHDAVDAARVIAENDLSQTLDSQRRDELGDLLRALGRMQAALRHMVGQVRASTDNISTASSEIATGNHDLSARTEQAAANLQQAASSMEQLTGTVKQSADSARQANQLAASAAEVAARGGDVVSRVVATMDDINASSKKIADIIGVIDGIAFQTNILALNAAVEAARAGEQGRGFAVVAGEVRNLAQRSAEAAKEIKALIGASVDKVESGSKLVADAGHTMQEIVGSVQRVTDIIGEITAAASEQSDGIGQVNASVVQLDQMTQQNAALVEESAAAAQSLKEQAVTLAEVVGTFRLEATGSGTK